MANAASLDAGTSALAPNLTQLLPPELLCTFTKSVVETQSAVARAPKGGGPVDLSTGSLTSASDVVTCVCASTHRVMEASAGYKREGILSF